MNIDNLKENNIRLMVTDLDGTLLDSKKNLRKETVNALQAAYERGIEIVPATGRFFKALPEAVSELPFLHYAITINGAEIIDLVKDASVATFGIPVPQAVEIMKYLDTLPIIYDCYMHSWGWMTRSLLERIPEFIHDKAALEFVRHFRKPVDELKEYISRENPDGCVQKIQFFTNDPQLRLEQLEKIKELFGDVSVTSASSNNVEINNIRANKGQALKTLAGYLGIDMKNTAAFGDGLNDLPMIKAAGLGIAMANAEPAVLEAAGFVTLSCDEDGVAYALNAL